MIKFSTFENEIAQTYACNLTVHMAPCIGNEVKLRVELGRLV